MRKIKDVLRLRHELGLGQRQIARSCSSGVGKSYLACALAHKACRDGYSAFYGRAAALFRDLAR